MNFDINPNNLSGVFSILYEYSLRNKILDEVAVREIIRIYMHENGLNGLISNVVFGNFEDSKTYGYYEINTRIIYFDLAFIIDTVYRRHYSDRFYINCVNLINQELIISIFHELNHAFRFSMSHEKGDISEEIIKNICKTLRKEPNLYSQFHDYFPHEKEANMFGFEMCTRLYQNLNNYIIDNSGLNNLYISYLRTIIDGYDLNNFLDNPLKKVILSSKCCKEELQYIKYLIMKKIIEIKKMTLYDRLTFGYPINDDEYEFIDGILNNVLTYQQDEKFDIKSLILSRK